MKNINGLISCFFIILTSVLYSQNLQVQYIDCTNCNTGDIDPNKNYQYANAPTPFITSDISSDFGRRDCPTCTTIWHKGVDMTAVQGDGDRGDKLLSMVNGFVENIRGNGNFKYIIIEGTGNNPHFGYAHIFRSGTNFNSMRSGDLVLTTMDAPYEDTYAIIDTDTGLGWGEFIGTVTFGNQEYFITPEIVGGDVVAPIGRSGTTNVHLHLYHLMDASLNVVSLSNTKDPLQFVQHDFLYPSGTPSPNPHIRILRNGPNVDQYPEGIDLTYPGSSTSTIMVRCILPNEGNTTTFQNHTMNIDNVEVLIKKDYEIGSLFRLIEGPNFDSKISHGARLNVDRYPRPGGPFSNTTDIAANQQIGTFNNGGRTGIKAFAYADGTGNNPIRPWDEFYFADFATRIHENDSQNGGQPVLANCPQNARYNDGNYVVKARVIDVRGGSTDSDEISFTIDNFKPFIEGLQVFIGSAEVYDMFWECNDNCEGSGGLHAVGGVTNEPVTDPDIASGMDVTVHTSEPMQDLNLAVSVSGSNLPAANISFISNSPDRQTWVFGANISGFVSPGTATAGTDIQFIFTGTDFPAPGNPPNQLLNLAGRYHPDGQQPNDACVRIPTRNQNGWANPENIPTGQELAHHFSIACGGGSGLVGNDDRINTVRYSGGSCLLADFNYDIDYDGCTVNFTNFSVGFPFFTTWNFGDGATSDVLNPSHAYNEGGCFTATLTITNGLQSSSASQEICLIGCGDNPGGSPNCQISGPTFAMPGETITLSAAGSPRPTSFSYEWSSGAFIDPVGSLSEQTVQFTLSEYLDNGSQATVFLDVINAQGFVQSCAHTITVSGVVPSVKLVVFGDREPGAFMDLVAVEDIWNIAGFPDYKFTIRQLTPGGMADYTSPWLPYAHVDICHPHLPNHPEPEAINVCLEDGIYEMCALVRDDLGTYQDCKEITIGTPPPPSPKIELINYATEDATPIELNAGDGCVGSVWYKLNQDPFPGNYGGGCTQEFIIDWHIVNLDSGIDHGGFSTYTDIVCNSGLKGLLNICSQDLGCDYGTLAVTANFYTASNYDPVTHTSYSCCQTPFTSPSGGGFSYAVTDPILINYGYAAPQIENVTMTDECKGLLSATIKGGCRQSGNTTSPCSGSQFYQNYKWEAFDIHTNERIPNFFEGNTNQKCVKVNRENPYFEQFEPGELALFRAKLTVTDYAGFTDERTELVSMELPLRINIPSDLSRCLGTVTSLSHEPVAVGGDGNYSFEWTLIPPFGPISISTDDPSNPMINIPANYSGGPVSFSLTVTDGNGGGCESRTQTFTLTVNSLQLDLPNQVVFACSELFQGTSVRTIGPANPDLGGSGDYNIQWTSNDPILGVSLLSDPTILNPTVLGQVNPPQITYTLTVTDRFGGCQASDNVVVDGLSPTSLFANAGPDLTIATGNPICFGGTATLGGYPSGNGTQYWTSDHPGFTGSTVQNPVLTEAITKTPGTYQFTLTVVDDFTGCSIQDEVTVSILDQWQYEGYESKIHFIVQGNGAPLWDGSNNNLLSGFQPPLTSQWLTNGASPYLVLPNNNGIPASSGFFTPTPQAPFLTLLVTDAYGCKMEFPTNRYVILEESPTITIESNPSPLAVCAGDEFCLDVTLKARPASNNQSLLPPTVSADYSYFTDRSSSNFDPIIRATGVLDLNLINGIEGIYQGNFCLAASGVGSSTASGYKDFVEISGNLNESSSFTSFETAIQVISTDAFLTMETINVCDDTPPFGLGLPTPYLSAQRHIITVQEENNCSGLYIPNAFNSPLGVNHGVALAGGLNGGVLIYNLVAEVGTYFHAYIDRCIMDGPLQSVGRDSLDQFLADENFISEDSLLVSSQSNREEEEVTSPISKQNGLSIIPNPFTGEVKIEYLIESENQAEVTLNLHSLAGNKIKTFFKNRLHNKGRYSIIFDGSELAPGMYFYELIVDNQRIVKRAIKITYYP